MERARKYTDGGKGWRPERRTVIYLAVIGVVLLFSAVFLPRLLPGKILEDEAVLGLNGTVSVALVAGEGEVRELAGEPPEGEGYSAWAISGNREEVAVAWFRNDPAGAGETAVQVRSAFSGRSQTEWQYRPENGAAKINQVGFVPQRNQIWFLAGGRFVLIDIKSGEVLPMPFKGVNARGSLPAPESVTFASFAPSGGTLAYVEGGALTVVRGLGIARGQGKLSSSVALRPGKTGDSAGRIIGGEVRCFAWLDEARMVVVIEGEEAGAPAAELFLLRVGSRGGARPLSLVTFQGQRVMSVSRAPVGTEFAALVDTDPRMTTRPGRYQLLRYGATGRLLGRTMLPRGVCEEPLSWTGP